MISNRKSNISGGQKEFNEKAQVYNLALKTNGHKENIEYQKKKQNEKPQGNRTSCRIVACPILHNGIINAHIKAILHQTDGKIPNCKQAMQLQRSEHLPFGTRYKEGPIVCR